MKEKLKDKLVQVVHNRVSKAKVKKFDCLGEPSVGAYN